MPKYRSGRRDDAEVRDVTARRQEPRGEGLGEGRRAQAAVPAHGDLPLPAAEKIRPDGPAERPDDVLVEVLADDAADVVFPEDAGVDVHKALPGKRIRSRRP